MHAGIHSFNWGLFSCVLFPLLKGMGFHAPGPGKGVVGGGGVNSSPAKVTHPLIHTPAPVR